MFHSLRSPGKSQTATATVALAETLEGHGGTRCRNRDDLEKPREGSKNAETC